MTHAGAKAQSLLIVENTAIADMTRRHAFAMAKTPKWKRCLQSANSNATRDMYLTKGVGRKRGYVDTQAEAVKSALRTLDLMRQIVNQPIPRPAVVFDRGVIGALSQTKRIAPSADGKTWCVTDAGRAYLAASAVSG